MKPKQISVQPANVIIFDGTKCELGEGALWHPTRHSLLWFDILNRRLCERDAHQDIAPNHKHWSFDELVSAAAWVDHDHLLIASESGLYHFNLADGSKQPLCPLEFDLPNQRSNDGRADPFGGFWISTMDKNAKAGQAAIYRYHHGEIKTLFDGLTIPNAICFSKAGDYAYFADSPSQLVWRVGLDGEGWPQGEKQIFLDFRQESFFPDGAIVDANGWFWNAQWGAGRVAAYDQQGKLQQVIQLPTPHTSCPAFGGNEYHRLFVTTAQEHLSNFERAKPEAGAVFVTRTNVQGRPEPAVKLNH